MASNLKQIYVGVNKADENRRGEDLYETPPLATYLLHKYAQPPVKEVVEPSAGRGSISIELQRCGYSVESYDLNDHPNKLLPIQTGFDVLDTKYTRSEHKALITNPPYFKDLPRKIYERGVREFAYTALFVRLTFLEGIKRKKIFETHPPSKIIFLSDRIKFKPGLIEEPIEMEDQIGGMIAYAWVIYDVAANDQEMIWVSLKDEYQEWRAHYEKTKV